MNILERQEVRILELETRVTEVQAHNTSLVNEGRMLRAQLKAARTLLHVALVDGPLTSIFAMQTGVAPEDGRVENRKLLDLYHRIELLESDAWTQTTQLAKQFVKEAHAMMVKDDTWHPVDFIEAWHKKFRDLLGD